MFNKIIIDSNKSGEGATPRCVALLVAAGDGSRMGNSNQGKMFININGKSLLEHCLDAFEESKFISEVIIIARAKDIISAYDCVRGKYQKLANIVVGGSTRQKSVENGLAHINNADYVAIHDVARPCIQAELIDKCIERAIQSSNGATLAVKVSDTIKKVENGIIIQNLERKTLWQMQTPQVFPYHKLCKAHSIASLNGIDSTDDTAVYMLINEKVEIVESTRDNIKVTYPQDVIFAERILEKYEDFNYYTSIQ